MNTNQPKVSVIMPAYNTEKYVKEAVDSIVNQTYQNWELVIVNNGSEDATGTILKTYTDPRILLIDSPTNIGPIRARNMAISKSTGKYLAILDSDDVALPDRLQKEVDFLDSHPDFGVIGGAVTLIDKDSKPLGITWRNPLPSEMIPGILLFQNYLANSSSMFRREACPPGDVYRDMSPADDYDLWSRIGTQWKMWNLPEILVKYRVHGANISTVQVDTKNLRIEQIVTEALARLNITPTKEELEIHSTNYGFVGESQIEFLYKREKWLQKIKRQNNTIKYYEQKAFDTVFTERWLASCSANANLGFTAWSTFWNSSLSKNIPKILWMTTLRFFVKCFIKKS